MAIRCLSPPLRLSGYLSANFVISKNFSSSFARSRLCCFFEPFSAIGSSMFSRTVSEGRRLKNWKTRPICFSLNSAFWSSFSVEASFPKIFSVPWLGVSSRPMILKRAVLPTPDLPLIEMKSPCFIVRFTPFSTSVTP